MVRALLPTRFHKKIVFIALLVTGCVFYSIYFALSGSSVYSESFLFASLSFNSTLSYLLTPSELSSPDDVKPKSLRTVANALYKSLSNSKLDNQSWKLTNKLLNDRLDASENNDYINTFVERRKKEHFYDPRITTSVYLSYLKEQYNRDETVLPFSWEDWIDFSSLNKYLGDHTISCQELLKKYDFVMDFELNENTTTETIKSKAKCYSNEDYMQTEFAKYRLVNLLPGFNFAQKYDRSSTFLGKAYNAKSYMLTFAPKPDQIIFLADNGEHYKAETKQSSSIVKNGLLKRYMADPSYDGFDPYFELQCLSEKYLAHNEQDFVESLTKKNKYTLEIPDSRFILEPLVQFKHLFDTDDTLLRDNELNFKNTIRYSLQVHPKDISKYFQEATIFGTHYHKDHRVNENGAHYDFRFFSGFVTEMPDSELSPHSPEKLVNSNPNDEIKSMASHFGIKNSVLSHLTHMLFTLTFHDGLILFPAHGTLLAWYFNSLSFPWDEDGDVQMPIEDLAEFCLRYNNSMIVENPRFGFAKGYVDCATTITHRDKGLGTNNIDARFIDVDSGLYIDITGLSVSDDTMDQKNFDKLKQWLPDTLHHEYVTDNGDDKSNKDIVLQHVDKKKVYDQHKANRIYNCRNKHYYSYDQLSPMRVTLFEGAPTFVAVNEDSLKSQLEIEYSPNSLTNVVFDKYYFSKYLRTWLSAYDILQGELELGFNPKPDQPVDEIKMNKDISGIDVVYEYYTHPTEIFSELVRDSLFDITLDTSIASKDLYRPKINLIEEVFHNKELAHAHTNEMRLFVPSWDLANKNIQDGVKVPEDWSGLGKWMLKDHAPPRISLFDYIYFAETTENEHVHQDQ